MYWVSQSMLLKLAFVSFPPSRYVDITEFEIIHMAAIQLLLAVLC